MDSNQIFSIDFVSIHYHLGETQCQIIECKIFWSWALYNYSMVEPIEERPEVFLCKVRSIKAQFEFT